MLKNNNEKYINIKHITSTDINIKPSSITSYTLFIEPVTDNEEWDNRIKNKQTKLTFDYILLLKRNICNMYIHVRLLTALFQMGVNRLRSMKWKKNLRPVF